MTLGPSPSRRLGVIGGTFDPVHYGHLDAADAATDALRLDEVLFIPSFDPPHRALDPQTSRYHRFAMVAMAIADRPACRASDLELLREGPSYTIETLHALHHEGWRPLQIFFIIGSDAFAEIAAWRAFPGVLEAANFVVIARPGTVLDAAIARTPELATRLRRPDEAGAASGTGVFPVAARTRDVSSTTIRRRLAAGEPIDDLVPPPVARHILLNQLYRPVNELHG
jgi:nicotinate-nucleotide adenylyltransferase